MNKTKDILVLIVAWIFMGSWLYVLMKTGFEQKSRYEIIEEKIDKIVSQTDVTADKVDSLEADFTEYRQNNRDVIDMLIDNLDDYKDEMQKEIDSIHQEIESVEIAKVEARQKRQLTYTPTVTYDSTDGLTARGGVNYYGEQKETYYNLNMNGVVNNAQSSGIEGDYWVREDGVKMYGEYVIVAANQDVHPYGTTVDTSLGEGIVLDTGTFANGNPTQVDIATDW